MAMNVTEDVRARYREKAEKDAASPRRNLWFSGARPQNAMNWTPGWKVGSTKVNNELAIVHVDKLEVGWVCVVGRQLVDERWVPRLQSDGGLNEDPEKPTDRYADPESWPDKWPSGDPKDPWQFKIRVPVEFTTGPTGTTAWFYSDSEACRLAIGSLELAFVDNGWRRPKVKLISKPHEKHPDSLADLAIKIMGFVDIDSGKGARAKKKSANGDAGEHDGDGDDDADPEPASKADFDKPIDDEIPF